MPPEAEKLRSTLQRLLTDELGWSLRFPYHEDGGELQPFSWNEAAQGPLTPVNLLRSKQWLQPIEESQVLAQWLQPEQVGAVNGAKWLIPDTDRAGILLDAAKQATRRQQYEKLLQAVQSGLVNRQTWILSHDEEYSLVVLLGQVAESEEASWIGIAPVVPIATPNTSTPIQIAPIPPSDQTEVGPDAAQPIQRIQAQIDQLGRVQIYGYYGGGYDQVHDSYLVQAIGVDANAALEQTLIRAGLLTIGQFGGFSPDSSTNQANIAAVEQLNQFLRQDLTESQVYQFHFWNQEQVYAVGRSIEDVWVGVELSSRFTYNP